MKSELSSNIPIGKSTPNGFLVNGLSFKPISYLYQASKNIPTQLLAIDMAEFVNTICESAS